MLDIDAPYCINCHTSIWKVDCIVYMLKIIKVNNNVADVENTEEIHCCANCFLKVINEKFNQETIIDVEGFIVAPESRN